MANLKGTQPLMGYLASETRDFSITNQVLIDSAREKDPEMGRGLPKVAPLGVPGLSTQKQRKDQLYFPKRIK